MILTLNSLGIFKNIHHLIFFCRADKKKNKTIIVYRQEYIKKPHNFLINQLSNKIIEYNSLKNILSILCKLLR